MKKRNLFAELTDGLDTLAAGREGKITLQKITADVPDALEVSPAETRQHDLPVRGELKMPSTKSLTGEKAVAGKTHPAPSTHDLIPVMLKVDTEVRESLRDTSRPPEILP